MKNTEELYQELSNPDPITRLKAIRQLSERASELALQEREAIVKRTRPTSE